MNAKVFHDSVNWIPVPIRISPYFLFQTLLYTFIFLFLYFPPLFISLKPRAVWCFVARWSWGLRGSQKIRKREREREREMGGNSGIYGSACNPRTSYKTRVHYIPSNTVYICSEAWKLTYYYILFAISLQLTEVRDLRSRREADLHLNSVSWPSATLLEAQSKRLTLPPPHRAIVRRRLDTYTYTYIYKQKLRRHKVRAWQFP